MKKKYNFKALCCSSGTESCGLCEVGRCQPKDARLMSRYFPPESPFKMAKLNWTNHAKWPPLRPAEGCDHPEFFPRIRVWEVKVRHILYTESRCSIPHSTTSVNSRFSVHTLYSTHSRVYSWEHNHPQLCTINCKKKIVFSCNDVFEHIHPVPDYLDVLSFWSHFYPEHLAVIKDNASKDSLAMADIQHRTS